MVPLNRELVSSYRLSTVTKSLYAAVWPQFATLINSWMEGCGGPGSYCHIGSYV